MENVWHYLGLYLGLELVDLCSGYPLASSTLAGGATPSEAAWVSLSPLVSAVLLASSVLLVFGCLCCRRTKGFQEFTDSGSTPNLSTPGGGYVNSAASPEFPLFPPPQPTNQSVRFEPLPEIVPPNRTKKPAAFNNAVSHGLSEQDWFAEGPGVDFPRQQLQYVREAGRGWFGRVVEGNAQHIVSTATTTPVVVKILRDDASPTDQMYFLHEVRAYRDLVHPNVLRMLGRCLETDPFLVLLEAWPTGDLKSFLCQNISTARALCDEGVTLNMACNIAAGLEHMLDNGFVHTDLAARNCLVTPDLTVKIGDYGHSIESFKEDYYIAGDVALPVRWCAPETVYCTDTTIQTKEVTPAANVWNLGVVLWEIAEFGKLPYEELTDDEVVGQVFGESNRRLPLPSLAAPHRDNLYLLMKLCWSGVDDRPALTQVHSMLKHLNSTSQRCQLDGHDSSLCTEDDFNRRWETFKPNTIPKRDDHSLPDTETPPSEPPTTLDIPIAGEVSVQAAIRSPLHLALEDHNSQFTSQNVSNNNQDGLDRITPSTVSPQLSMASSFGGEFFGGALQSKDRSASLQNLRGSLDDLSENLGQWEERKKRDRKVEEAERERRDAEKTEGEPDFESWLKGVETTDEEEAKFVAKISEAIRDLDDALALERTSSSSGSEVSSKEATPVKEFRPSEQNSVLDFRLGSRPRGESPEEDSLRNSNSSDTEEETWRGRIERGEFSEKVKAKSKSVADLMILTHIDPSDGSDSEPPSLTWSFERGSVRTSFTRNSNNNSFMRAPPVSTSFGSEGDIHKAVLGEEFLESLQKIQLARRDSNKNILSEVAIFLEREKTHQDSIAPLLQTSVDFLPTNHNRETNFLAFDASGKPQPNVKESILNISPDASSQTSKELILNVGEDSTAECNITEQRITPASQELILSVNQPVLAGTVTSRVLVESKPRSAPGDELVLNVNSASIDDVNTSSLQSVYINSQVPEIRLDDRESGQGAPFIPEISTKSERTIPEVSAVSERTIPEICIQEPLPDEQEVPAIDLVARKLVPLPRLVSRDPFVTSTPCAPRAAPRSSAPSETSPCDLSAITDVNLSNCSGLSWDNSSCHQRDESSPLKNSRSQQRLEEDEVPDSLRGSTEISREVGISQEHLSSFISASLEPTERSSQVSEAVAASDSLLGPTELSREVGISQEHLSSSISASLEPTECSSQVSEAVAASDSLLGPTELSREVQVSQDHFSYDTSPVNHNSKQSEPDFIPAPMEVSIPPQLECGVDLSPAVTSIQPLSTTPPPARNTNGQPKESHGSQEVNTSLETLSKSELTDITCQENISTAPDLSPAHLCNGFSLVHGNEGDRDNLKELPTEVHLLNIFGVLPEIAADSCTSLDRLKNESNESTNIDLNKLPKDKEVLVENYNESDDELKPTRATNDAISNAFNDLTERKVYREDVSLSDRLILENGSPTNQEEVSLSVSGNKGRTVDALSSVILGPCEDFTMDYFKGLKTTFPDSDQSQAFRLGSDQSQAFHSESDQSQAFRLDFDPRETNHKTHGTLICDNKLSYVRDDAQIDYSINGWDDFLGKTLEKQDVSQYEDVTFPSLAMEHVPTAQNIENVFESITELPTSDKVKTVHFDVAGNGTGTSDELSRLELVANKLSLCDKSEVAEVEEDNDELGLDAKHCTPDDERSSDSGFRDKGSLSESCEDACDEKYNLEDIEAELEETFNQGGFSYKPEDEERFGSPEEGGTEPHATNMSLDLNSTSVHKPLDVGGYPEETQIAKDFGEFPIFDYDQSPVRVRDAGIARLENVQRNFAERFVDECIDLEQDVRSEKRPSDSKKGGWYLHPPDGSQTEALDEYLSPKSESSTSSKLEDSENSYVSYHLDEEYATAIRNELREKLPCANQNLDSDSEEDITDEEEVAGDRQDIMIHYNMYPAPLSPILEERESMSSLEYSPYVDSFNLDSEPDSLVFSMDSQEELRKETEAKKFEEDIREALENVSYESSSSSDREPNTTVLLEDLDTNVKRKVKGTSAEVEDDVLVVDTETNEARLVESPIPKLQLAFVNRRNVDMTPVVMTPEFMRDDSVGVNSETFVIGRGRFEESPADGNGKSSPDSVSDVTVPSTDTEFYLTPPSEVSPMGPPTHSAVRDISLNFANNEAAEIVSELEDCGIITGIINNTDADILSLMTGEIYDYRDSTESSDEKYSPRSLEDDFEEMISFEEYSQSSESREYAAPTPESQMSLEFALSRPDFTRDMSPVRRLDYLTASIGIVAETDEEDSFQDELERTLKLNDLGTLLKLSSEATREGKSMPSPSINSDIIANFVKTNEQNLAMLNKTNRRWNVTDKPAELSLNNGEGEQNRGDEFESIMKTNKSNDLSSESLSPIGRVEVACDAAGQSEEECLDVIAVVIESEESASQGDSARATERNGEIDTNVGADVGRRDVGKLIPDSESGSTWEEDVDEGKSSVTRRNVKPEGLEEGRDYEGDNVSVKVAKVVSSVEDVSAKVVSPEADNMSAKVGSPETDNASAKGGSSVEDVSAKVVSPETDNASAKVGSSVEDVSAKVVSSEADNVSAMVGSPEEDNASAKVASTETDNASAKVGSSVDCNVITPVKLDSEDDNASTKVARDSLEDNMIAKVGSTVDCNVQTLALQDSKELNASAKVEDSKEDSVIAKISRDSNENNASAKISKDSKEDNASAKIFRDSMEDNANVKDSSSQEDNASAIVGSPEDCSVQTLAQHVVFLEAPKPSRRPKAVDPEDITLDLHVLESNLEDWSRFVGSKAPMPSPEEESWRKLLSRPTESSSMLGFSEGEVPSDTAASDGSCYRGLGLSEDGEMSTSFSAPGEEDEEDYAPDWESDSEGSSSSGEFIWREGDNEKERERESLVRDLQPQAHTNSRYLNKPYECLPEFPMEVIAEEDEDEEDDEEDDDDEDSSVGSGTEFVPSAWDSQATPSRSALRSPDKKVDGKKNVWFKKQKYHCVYEYPRENSDTESEPSEGQSWQSQAGGDQSGQAWGTPDPVQTPGSSWQPPPDVDYASYADWEVTDGDGADQETDTESESQVARVKVEPFDFYKLSNVDYDFSTGVISEDGEFFISSSARPFQQFNATPSNLFGHSSSQFFPGQSLDQSQAGADSFGDEIDTSPRNIAGSKVAVDASAMGETDDEVVDIVVDADKLSAVEVTVPVTTERDFSDGTPTPPSPLSPTGLGELRHTRDRLKLNLPSTNAAFLLDVPGKWGRGPEATEELLLDAPGKRGRGVAERGEASLLDSGEDTEDSGIESSNGMSATITLKTTLEENLNGALAEAH